MATYTETNGRLVCTGTDITSDGDGNVSSITKDCA